MISCGPEESSRQALDLYRNSIVHFFAAPSFLARRTARGAGISCERLREDLATSGRICSIASTSCLRGEVLLGALRGLRGAISRNADGSLRPPTKDVRRDRLEGEVSLESLASPDARESSRSTRLPVRGASRGVGAPIGSGARCYWKRAIGELRAGRVARRGAAGGEALNDTTLSNAIDLLLRIGM